MPGGYVTIMAYTATGFTKRIAYFSSPDLTYTSTDGDEIATGTATRYLPKQNSIISSTFLHVNIKQDYDLRLTMHQI